MFCGLEFWKAWASVDANSTKSVAVGFAPSAFVKLVVIVLAAAVVVSETPAFVRMSKMFVSPAKM